MTKIEQVQIKLQNAKQQVEQLEKEFTELRLEALRQVKVSKKGQTTTLTFGDRVIKAKRNSHYRLKVVEGNRTLDSDYMGSIHDLRFEIAMRAI
jgi:predicted RNase H-like nuclease (RuvC/YqgF family)